MVLVALHHAVQAVHHRSAPVVTALGQVAVCAMAFDVRLVNHINAVLIAKIVHYRVVRVVRHAERIDIEFLHQDDVLFHALVIHCTAVIRIELVTVHAVELDRHAVHQQARGTVFLLDFNLPKTNLVAFDLDNLAGIVLDGEYRRVEVRSFCRPAIRLDIRDFEMHALFATVRTDARNLLHRRGNHFGTRIVVKRKFDGKFARSRTSGIVNPCRSLQQTVGIVIRESSVNLEILNMHGRHGVDINVAHDARKANEVLVFEPGTVAPAEHLHGDVVLALAQVLVDIKFMTCESVFGISHIVAVHPDVVSRFHAFKVQTDALAIPLFGNGEGAAVVAHRVKVGRCARSGDAVVLRPRVNHVRINRMVVAEQLPGRRNRDFVPAGNIVVVLVEIVVALARFFHVEEFPLARQRLVPFRRMAVALHGLFHRSVGHRGHVRVEAVHTENARFAVPFVVRAALRKCSSTGKKADKAYRRNNLVHNILFF